MSIGGVGETIRAGDAHIADAPLEDAEDAVRGLDVNHLIVRAAQLLADLNSIRNGVTAALSLTGESDIQISAARLEYGEAILSSDAPAAIRLQESAGAMLQAVLDTRNEVHLMIPSIDGALKALGSASMLLTACEGHYVQAVTHAEATTALRPQVVEASDAYKQQILGGGAM